MFDADPAQRNRLSRMLAVDLELQFASWLESQGHTIVGLEATGGGLDIETRSESTQTHAFEVKFIGIEDGDLR